MGVLDALIACSGNWRGTNTLQDPPAIKPDESPSTATVTPVLGGRFARVHYTWNYRGSPQEGIILFGHDTQANNVTAYWIDTWHMGDKLMACQGPAKDSALLSVRGSYAAPPGPDWGWRIDLHVQAGMLRLVMFNITPDGEEALAVEANYNRA